MKVKWIPVKAFGIGMREFLTQSLRNLTFSHTLFLTEDFLREWRSVVRKNVNNPEKR